MPCLRVSNRRAFSWQAGTQSTEPHQPGLISAVIHPFGQSRNGVFLSFGFQIHLFIYPFIIYKIYEFTYSNTSMDLPVSIYVLESSKNAKKKKKRSRFNNTCILEQKGEQLLKTNKYSMKSNNKFYR